MRVVSIDSAAVSAGQIVGTRLANIVLPVPVTADPSHITPCLPLDQWTVSNEKSCLESTKQLSLLPATQLFGHENVSPALFKPPLIRKERVGTHFNRLLI